MNFENREAFVIPFSVQKSSVWKEVIRYLSEKETTPVEAICHSRVVSIDKEYYPVERLEISYTAKWNAVSIFKECWTEQETHYEQQIHYFDRFGKEHEKSGFDYYDTKAKRWKSGALHPFASTARGYSGDALTKPWEPREVTVPVTENVSYEKETGRKRNSGEIKGNHTYYHDKEYPFPMHLENHADDDLFSSIIFHSDSVENQKIPYSQEAVKDGMVIRQSKPLNENDVDTELSRAKSMAKKECIWKIPGQAYADLHMEFDSDEICQIWYCPVYHVIYEFSGQKYECFVSGNFRGSVGMQMKSGNRLVSDEREDSVKGKIDPEDVSIENIKQQYDNEYSALKNRKKKCWLKFIWIWLGVCGIPIPIALLFMPLATIQNGIGIIIISIVTSILPVVFVGTAIYLCWKNYKEIKNIKRELTQNNEAKKNIVPFRQAKKKTIMEIILNDNLSDSEKAMRCEAILKNQI